MQSPGATQSGDSPTSSRMYQDMGKSTSTYDNRTYNQDGTRGNEALLQLLRSYAMFMNESSDVILDMDLVLKRLQDAVKKLKPPQGYNYHFSVN